MRYFYAVDQGEGISGGPDIGIQTTQLVTCVGVAMANTETMNGGLYHYGAKTIATPAVTGALIQMINDLKPTHLRVTPPPAPTGYTTQSSLQGTTKEDRPDQGAGGTVEASVTRRGGNWPRRGGVRLTDPAHGEALPVHSFRTLLADLGTLTKNTVCFGGKGFVAVLAKPTAVPSRALHLLGTELSGT
jgi:hypothetical protein